MIKCGLDFGTTNSSISYWTEEGPRLLPIDTGAIDPSVIRSLLYFYHRDLVSRKNKYGRVATNYEGDFHYAFGQKALESYLSDNKDRKPGIVRQIFTGKMIQPSISPNAPPADLVAEYFEEVDYGTGRLLQALKTALKSPIYKGTNIFGKFFTLEQMIGIFVSQIKTAADQVLGEKIESLRVGRPVVFLEDPGKDQAVEERLKESLRMVGFKNIEFEYEPVAAARYFLWKYPKPGKKVLVFDFGGGTLDVAIMELGDTYRVLATGGVYVGGNLFNSDIMRTKLNKYFGSELRWGELNHSLPHYFMETLDSWYSIPNLNNYEDMGFLARVRQKNSDPEALERLIYLIKMNLGFEIYEAIEGAKQKLSSQETANIVFKDGLIDINVPMTRAEFEKIIEPRIEAVEKVVWQCLAKAKLEPREIDVVVRTGGSSLIPKVENMLAKIFGREKVQLFDAFTSIAAGLAID